MTSVSITALKKNLRYVDGIQLANRAVAKMAYVLLGDLTKPCLVMCQGASMNFFAWDAIFLKSLLSHFSLFIFDYPGLTGSSTLENSDDHSALAQAHILHAALVKCGIKPHAILGYSMGAWIALSYASHYPIERLILIASDAGGLVDRPSEDYFKLWDMMDNAQTFKQHMHIFRMVFPNMGLLRTLLLLYRFARSVKIGCPVNSDVIARQNILYEKRYVDKLDTIHIGVKTLAILPGEDKVVPQYHPDTLLTHLPGASFYHFPDAAHGLPHQHPAETAQVIIDYVFDDTQGVASKRIIDIFRKNFGIENGVNIEIPRQK